MSTLHYSLEPRQAAFVSLDQRDKEIISLWRCESMQQYGFFDRDGVSIQPLTFRLSARRYPSL